MRKTHLLTALIALMLCAPAGMAEETRYRVEVIVLAHLGHAETPRETAALRDFGDALDFLAPQPLDAEDEATEAVAEPAAAVDTVEAIHGVEADTSAEPPAVVQVEELGDVMQDAFRRLRLSGPFRPLVALAWEQPSTEPFPVLRVHDETVVMTEDPWAAIRERLAAGEDIDVDAWIQAGLVPPIPPASAATAAGPTDVAPGDTAPADDPAAILESLPPPRLHYALDGTVSLVRSRFLHFEVDLQQREALYTEPAGQALTLPRGLRAMPAAEPLVQDDMTTGSATATPSAFRVFDMRQRRQVRTGQVEYFDSPVLGVLAYFTELEPEAEED